MQHFVVKIIVIVGLSQTGLWAQMQGPDSGLPAGAEMHNLHRPDGMPDPTQEMLNRQVKKLREEHQKEVFSDSDRLVHLATELKAEADRGDRGTQGELKDVDEIAKLAKRLSERIKNQ